ncbi:MAG: hypothetical protein MZV64_16990 [Ignavibacteriales bacterium]|nr:hypothetical protein [Ignavibacteriales bacterium]
MAWLSSRREPGSGTRSSVVSRAAFGARRDRPRALLAFRPGIAGAYGAREAGMAATERRHPAPDDLNADAQEDKCGQAKENLRARGANGPRETLRVAKQDINRDGEEDRAQGGGSDPDGPFGDPSRHLRPEGDRHRYRAGADSQRKGHRIEGARGRAPRAWRGAAGSPAPRHLPTAADPRRPSTPSIPPPTRITGTDRPKSSMTWVPTKIETQDEEERVRRDAASELRTLGVAKPLGHGEEYRGAAHRVDDREQRREHEQRLLDQTANVDAEGVGHQEVAGAQVLRCCASRTRTARRSIRRRRASCPRRKRRGRGWEAVVPMQAERTSRLRGRYDREIRRLLPRRDAWRSKKPERVARR